MPKALELIQKYHPEVKTVVDAKRTVRVSVIEEDCAKGSKKAPQKCALAKAFEREKEYDGAIISTSVSYLIKGDRAMRFMTPEAVTREIISFDRHADFSLGRYSLNAPGEGETLEARRAVGKAAYKKSAEAKAKKKAGRVRASDGSTGYKNHKTVGVRSL